jgi:hypothetical protein
MTEKGHMSISEAANVEYGCHQYCDMILSISMTFVRIDNSHNIFDYTLSIY